MALVLAPIMVVYVHLYRYYRKSCVELQRLDSNTRSPIQSHFLESLSGLVSVRAFGPHVVRRYRDTNCKHVNRNDRALLALVLSNRWLSARLEILGATVGFSAALLAYIFSAQMTPGAAGLCVMWAIQFVVSCNFNTQNLTEAESKMTSVERVQEYARVSVEETATILSQVAVPPESWPESGSISFTDAVLSYRDDLEPALKGMSCTIDSGERIGIVGRTGAGKSTIATALYRLRDLSAGTIVVDGIDISKIALGDVRGRGISIITQDPLVFSGSLRLNLDPFSDFTDAELWDALRAVEMDQVIREMQTPDSDSGGGKEDENSIVSEECSGSLEVVVEEAGKNFSVGQLQLLCFARAMLQRPKILILDEATANCDAETDAKVQQHVRSYFSECTLLVIAHRLNTIMDSDRILVMDSGKVAELAPPLVLLSNPRSIFSELVNATGAVSAAALRKQAEEAQIPTKKVCTGSD